MGMVNILSVLLWALNVGVAFIAKRADMVSTIALRASCLASTKIVGIANFLS